MSRNARTNENLSISQRTDVYVTVGKVAVRSVLCIDSPKEKSTLVLVGSDHGENESHLNALWRMEGNDSAVNPFQRVVLLVLVNTILFSILDVSTSKFRHPCSF